MVDGPHMYILGLFGQKASFYIYIVPIADCLLYIDIAREQI